MGTLRTTNIQHADASAAGIILAADGTVSGLRATQNTQSGVAYSLALTDSGRTVTLSNAASVTVTLPAQATVAWNVGETLSLLNLGAGTVTITPAADVTINGTPLTLATSKGGSLFRTASNTWTFIPTGGEISGLTLITSQTFSAASTVSVNSCFSSTYENYLVTYSLAFSGSDVLLRLRYRASGTDNTSGYKFAMTRYGSDGGAYSQGSISSTFILLSSGGSNLESIGTIRFMKPNTVNANKSQTSESCGESANIFLINSNAGSVNSATQFDGFTIFPASGTVAGTIRVYGYQN